MKTDILKGDTYSLIDEVPLDAYDIQIAEDDDPQYVLVWLTPGITPQGRLFLPAGKWQKVGFGNEITEEQWKGIVDDPIWIGGFGNMYSNYVDDITHAKEIWKRTGPFNTATESGHSWIRSHGMKPETTLILKQLNKATI